MDDMKVKIKRLMRRVFCCSWGLHLNRQHNDDRGFIGSWTCTDCKSHHAAMFVPPAPPRPGETTETTQMGLSLVIGIKSCLLPVRGFPDGKKRIRMVAGATIVFVRPKEGGIRKFYIKEKDGAWCPAAEVQANREEKK